MMHHHLKFPGMKTEANGSNDFGDSEGESGDGATTDFTHPADDGRLNPNKSSWPSSKSKKIIKYLGGGIILVVVGFTVAVSTSSATTPAYVANLSKEIKPARSKAPKSVAGSGSKASKSQQCVPLDGVCSTVDDCCDIECSEANKRISCQDNYDDTATICFQACYD